MSTTVDYSFDNTAPVASAHGVPALDNTAPAGVDLPSFTPSNVAPAAADTGIGAPDNAAPAEKSPGTFNPDNTAPVASATGIATADNDPARGQHARPDTMAKPYDETVNTPILKAEGALALNQLFGWTKLHAGSALVRAQLALEEPPVGGPVTVALVKPDGTPWGVSINVAAGAQFGETVLDPATGFAAGDEIRGKPTVVGLTSPGGFGTLTLFFQLT